jgi:hypothetical protein
MAAITAERDLLFGMLALQNGLINQGQLVAAFQAWSRDKARSLAEHLVDRGALEAGDHQASPVHSLPRGSGFGFRTVAGSQPFAGCGTSFPDGAWGSGNPSKAAASARRRRSSSSGSRR